MQGIRNCVQVQYILTCFDALSISNDIIVLIVLICKMTSILDFTSYLSDDERLPPEMFVSAPKSHKINTLSNYEPQLKKRGLIYILIAILFLVYMKVNFAGILNFFFQIYSSVTFSPNPICYHKYVLLTSTCLAVYL